MVLAVVTLVARSTNAGIQEQLEAYRQQIDWLDERIVELVQRRASSSRKGRQYQARSASAGHGVKPGATGDSEGSRVGGSL